MFLLDTNVVSQRQKRRPDPSVTAWLGTLSPGEMFVSVVTFMEIEKGIELVRARNKEAAEELDAWLDGLGATENVLDVTQPVARAWGRLLARARPDLAADALIAATAITHGLTVATGNVSDFLAFPVEVFNPFDARRD
jgi:predicted nucleic acid-binding protein